MPDEFAAKRAPDAQIATTISTFQERAELMIE